MGNRREGWRQKWDLERQGLDSHGRSLLCLDVLLLDLCLCRIILVVWESVRLPLWESGHDKMVLWSEVGRSGWT